MGSCLCVHAGLDDLPRALLDRGRPGVLPGSLVVVGDGRGVTASVGHVLVDHAHRVLFLRTAKFLDLKESLSSTTGGSSLRGTLYLQGTSLQEAFRFGGLHEPFLGGSSARPSVLQSFPGLGKGGRGRAIGQQQGGGGGSDLAPWPWTGRGLAVAGDMELEALGEGGGKS